MTADLLTALGIGLAGAGHCLGMCGGIAAALNLGGTTSTTTTLAYHGGRLLSYTLLGGALGLAAGSIDIAAWTIALRYLAGLLLVGMGLYVGGWWLGMLWLERGGARLWQPVQRWSSRFVPVQRPGQAVALGLFWGLMPCGLIYSALAWAATAQDATRSALLMLVFGIGTLPAMLATSLGARSAQELLNRRGLKKLIAVSLIAAGAWTLYLTWSHSSHLLAGPAPPGEEETGHHHH